jgi:hypothetical protein
VALIDPFRVCIPYKNKEVIYKNKEGTCLCLCFGCDLSISYILCFNFSSLLMEKQKITYV